MLLIRCPLSNIASIAAFEECQYLDRITWLISSILEVVDVSADEDDLSEVRSALLPIASRWKDVGIELKSKLADLDSKQAVHPNSPDYLRNAVSRWLQKGYNTTKHGPPTWRKLVRAILVDAGGNRKNPALAEKLADWQGGKYYHLTTNHQPFIQHCYT